MALLMGCGAELSPKALEAEVKAYFGPEGIEPDRVRCPGSLKREALATIVCEAVLAGETVDVVVEVADDEGALRVEPRHATLVTQRVAPEIAQTLKKQGMDVARVECEGTVWVARPQARHRCTVTDAEGQRFAWTGTFSGEGAKHRARIEPLTGAGR